MKIMPDKNRRFPILSAVVLVWSVVITSILVNMYFNLQNIDGDQHFLNPGYKRSAIESSATNAEASAGSSKDVMVR